MRKVANRSSGKETIRGLLRSRVSNGIKDRLRPKPSMGIMTKAGIGLAVVGGSVAAGYILAKRGSVVVNKPSVQYKKNVDSGREAHSAAMQSVGGANVSQLMTDT